MVESGEAIVFNIQKFSVHDGPGIRTTVFFKGCPLQCRWCSNAESMSDKAELGVIRSLCDGCGKCVDGCPEGAIDLNTEGIIRINREKCNACGECVGACPTGALAIYGRQVTVEEVFLDVCRDRPFYESGGGGVTASGGEPLRQAGFVASLFRRCREAGIGTCLDTCGCAETDTLKRVLEYADFVLYDIKHMNTDFHRRFTGVPNDLILRNARVVADSGASMLCRIPLVEGINDTEDNISETARFVRTLGDDVAVELLPYHRLGIAKYQTLDRPYPGESLSTPPRGKIDRLISIFTEYGVSCTTGE